MPSALYIHIPFCASKCLYCSFSSIVGKQEIYKRYCHALCTDLLRASAVNRGEALESIFLGGGTPSILSDHLLGMLLDVCHKEFLLCEHAEITIECNPDSFLEKDALSLRKRGVNRISFGIQSLHDHDLKILGRKHDAKMAATAIKKARQEGFNNLNIDLMYGLPGQSSTDWHQVLSAGLAFFPEHLSVYQLTIEDGTPFAGMVTQKQIILPDEESILEMDDVTRQLCADAGLEHYEISNYARPGFACRHNLIYWHNEQYIGCGAGAVGFINGRRQTKTGQPGKYCDILEHGGNPIEMEECLDALASFKESVVMGLRLKNGVQEDRLRRRYGLSFQQVYGESLVPLIAGGWVARDQHGLRLTPDGWRVANVIMAALV